MKKEFGFYFWVHLALIIPAYLSPFLINWKLIILGVLILQIQYWIIGGCFLTHLEMGKDKNEIFLWYYLRKIYPNLESETAKFIVRVVLPIILVFIGFVLQVGLKFKPLLQILK